MILSYVSLFLFSTILAHESIPEPSIDLLQSLYSNLPTSFKLMQFSDSTQGLATNTQLYSKSPCFCTDKSFLISPNDEFPLRTFISHLSDTQKLIVRAMYEKLNSTETSVKNKFFQSLSSEFLHPGSLSKPHLKLFQKVNFHEVDIESFIEAESFTEIFRALEKIEGLDIEMRRYASYIWAAFHVKSKKFKVKDTNGNIVDGLLPFIDLVGNFPNRGMGDKANLVDLGNKICVICSWDRQPGEMVFRDYGMLSTLEYLLKFGTVLKNNPYDKIKVFYSGKNYTLLMEGVNKELLTELGKGVSGLRKYRNGIEGWVKVGMGIREVRRKILPVQDSGMRTILEYGVEIRRSLYRHLKIVDLELMSELYNEVLKS